MEALVDAGKVKSIGISNFSMRKIGRLFESARITPEVHQLELHPYDIGTSPALGKTLTCL
jgi:diketogulonate reductase-like aldo/keto reductase